MCFSIDAQANSLAAKVRAGRNKKMELLIDCEGKCYYKHCVIKAINEDLFKREIKISKFYIANHQWLFCRFPFQLQENNTGLIWKFL